MSCWMEVLDHEKRLWSRRYQALHREDSLDAPEFAERCSRFVGAATLRGGVTTRDAAEALVGRLQGPDEKHFLRFMRSIYQGRKQPDQETYLAGLEPDLLGEALVADVLMDVNTPDTYLNLAFQDTDDTQLRNGFTVLDRISLHHQTQVEQWVSRLLDVDVPGHARPALHAAMSLGELSAFAPLGLVLSDALRREGTTELAAEFERLVPEQTVSLREVAEWATRRLLEATADTEPDEEAAQERARLLNNLGSKLSALGRREQALEATQEAVDIYRQLAKDRPDAYLPDLARSLGALGSNLRAASRPKDASAAFVEGIRALKPAFLALPAAHRPPMAAPVRDYVTVSGELGEEPDGELLAPIVTKLEEMGRDA